MGFEVAPPTVINLDSPPTGPEENIVALSSTRVERVVDVDAGV